ncbi:hypothetical protein ABBQ32_005543 [Trebouxia sp. C0010 RCD-2024]
MNLNLHPTGHFLTEYTGAVVHFAAKNTQLLVSAAEAYAAGWKKPFSWDEVAQDLTAEKAFPEVDLEEIFSSINITAVDELKEFVVSAAELFGGTQWSYMSTLHIVFVRVLLTKALAIPLVERKIMAGMAVGFWQTHMTLFDLPWLALDNSKQHLNCLYGTNQLALLQSGLAHMV